MFSEPFLPELLLDPLLKHAHHQSLDLFLHVLVAEDLYRWEDTLQTLEAGLSHDDDL